MAKKMKMRDDEVVAAVRAEYSLVSNEGNDVISQQRINSGYSFTNVDTLRTAPTTKMSSVKMFFTPMATQTLVAHQSKIFCSNKETVIFQPTGQDEIKSAAADQLSKMVNHVLHQKNNGFKIITDLLRSAAVYKNGVAKVVYNEKPEIIEEELPDVDDIQKELIAQQRETEGWEVKVKGDMMRLTRMKSSIDVEVIPPEEFMINEGTTSINDDELTRFVAHRKLMLKGDVLAMFPDADEADLSSATDLGDNYEKDARHYRDGTYDVGTEGGSSSDEVMTVEIVESWIRVDKDGDGYPEWRHVFTTGSTLLMDEEWHGPIPFASYTFFPVPHKFYGLSVYDRLYSLEEQATGLMRSAQDFARLSNTFRLLAREGSIDARTLNSGRPGVIETDRSFEAKDVLPVPTPAGTGLSATTALLHELRMQVIGEIGIDPISGQVSTDIEKSGNDAAKTAMAIDNASVKMESYSRMFADGALRDIIWLIAVNMVKYKDSGCVQDALNSVTPNTPFIAGELGLENILDKSDLKAKVGLGHQTGQQKIQAAQIVGQLMAQLAADPTQAMYNLVLNAMEGLGFEDPVKEIGSIQTWMAKAQQLQMIQQQQAQAAQMQVAEIQQKMQLEQQRFEFERMIKLEELRGSMDIDQMKAIAEVDLKQAQARKATAETVLATQEADTAEVKVII